MPREKELGSQTAASRTRPACHAMTKRRRAGETSDAAAPGRGCDPCGPGGGRKKTLPLLSEISGQFR